MEHQTQPIGTIASLWRYPVKSMQGEEVSQVHLSPRGFFGDRDIIIPDFLAVRVDERVAAAVFPYFAAGIRGGKLRMVLGK